MTAASPDVFAYSAATRAAALVLAAAPTVLLLLMLIVVLVSGLPLFHPGVLLAVLLAIPGWVWVYTARGKGTAYEFTLHRRGSARR